ncbi:hypothetical protein ACRYCC_04890 [Actinomadura scrupuli]|uniref:hypothetical protein n=1 Tax=Actinomadura scrupuli TaxID=559629 RepID=UPI003D9852BD
MDKNDLGEVAEQWFNRYLDDRGYTFQEKPDPGGARRAGRLVQAGDRPVLCEVTAFTADGRFEDIAVPEIGAEEILVGEPVARDLTETLQPIREQISAAASAGLRRWKDKDGPLVLVLADPMDKPIPLEPSLVVAAMYGDPEDARPAAGEPAWVAGEKGRMTARYPSVSAVAVLRLRTYAQDWVDAWISANSHAYSSAAQMLTAIRRYDHAAPDGDYVVLDVFETLSPEAVPLPRDIFNGPRDARYGPTPEGDGLMPVPVGPENLSRVP